MFNGQVQYVPAIQPSPAQNVQFLPPSPNGGGFVALPQNGGILVQQPQQQFPQPQQFQQYQQFQQIPQQVQGFVQIPSPFLPNVQLPSQPQIIAPIANVPMLHPLLSVNKGGVQSYPWELFAPPNAILSTVQGGAGMSACNPPVAEMRILAAEFPWTISIKKKDGSAISVADVLNGIFEQLQALITHPEYRLVPEKHRKKMTEQWQKRAALYGVGSGELEKGIKRIDYLVDKNVFLGLRQDEKRARELMLVNDAKMPITWILSLAPSIRP